MDDAPADTISLLVLAVAVVCLAAALILRRAGGASSRAWREIERFVLQSHPTAYLLCNENGQVLGSNAAGQEMLETLEAPDLSQLPELLTLGCDGSQTAELALRTSSGARLLLEAHKLMVPSLDGARALFLRDVTGLREAEQELIDEAHFDVLTALPNRRLFYKQLDVSLAKAKEGEHPLALILFDLDRFKETNDSLGHKGGDELLRKVAELARGAVRSRDVVSRVHNSRDGHLNVARLGGDEFVIVLSEIARPEDACDVAERVLQSLNTPVSIFGARVVPSASIGIAVFPQDGSEPDSLFRAADQALYHAKELGRNQCQLYHPRLNRIAQRRRAIRADLGAALAARELDVLYQPIVDISCGSHAGAEALLRWNHPKLGPIPPEEFVSIAETSGLAGRLGHYVLTQACQDIARFDFGGAISVNVCPSELSAPTYFDEFASILREHAVRPQSVHVEITERALFEESVVAETNLRDLRGIGVAVYLDDFGTGRSSLSDLLKHSVDGIKLDRSFVTEAVSDRTSAGVIRALMQLAAELGLEVVAEGVEEAEQAVFLRSVGCTRAQGYLWAKAMHPSELF